MQEREQSSVVEIFSSLIQREDSPVATAKRMQKTPLENTPKDSEPADLRTGVEILAESHNTAFKGLFEQSYNNGVKRKINDSELEVREEKFRDLILYNENVTKSELIDFVMELTVSAKFGEAVKLNDGFANARYRDYDRGGTCR